jgi:hypothetical protein
VEEAQSFRVFHVGRGCAFDLRNVREG